MESVRSMAVRHGPLRPGELAEAAVLGDVSLVMEVIGWFAPLGIAGIFQALAVIPFAVLAARHRLRAAIVAAIAASTVASLVGGLGIVAPTMIAAALGLSAGIAYRRRWSNLASVAFTTLIVGVPLAGITDAAEAASPGYRKLAFAQVKIPLKVVSDVLDSLRLKGATRDANNALNWVISHWWVSLPAAELALVFLVAVGCLRLRPFLGEVRRHVPPPMNDEAVERSGDLAPDAAAAAPQPVPVSMRHVSYRYPGSDVDALADISIDLQPGRFLAVVGPNGCGKSTLVRVLAGRIVPRTGELIRGGPAGLGVIGGTAIVFQRPESQVLGVRVRDDIFWGLAPAARLDVGDLLSRVGLGGFEDRETSTMSGGELQRLAIASALARSPKLLVSDEATAMIDAPGREEVVSLLRQLSDAGLAVVHVTHRAAEAAVADEVLALRAGGLVSDQVGEEGPSHSSLAAFTAALEIDSGSWLALSPKPTSRSRPVARAGSTSGGDRIEPAGELAPARVYGAQLGKASARRGAQPLVRLQGAGYVYAEGTPWARRALEGIDLDIFRGEGVVLTGPNGSGKSTLAWLLAGLTEPTDGEATLDGAPISEHADRVGIAFQHARLQLLRPTVIADVSLGADEDRARRALLSVGLDPDEMGPRRVDDLSGGQQRRVALAGLLVRRPDLIVLDEPYAGLDDEARKALAWTLASARRLSGVTVVVVTHDLDNAEVLGERLIYLEDGRIEREEALGTGG
jgi:energy-coupling factor transport system ATP-binding protein